MPGNTLVVKIYQNLGAKEFQNVYIFYDHDMEAYGIRGCRRNSEYNHDNKFSFYCARIKDVVNYLKFSIISGTNDYIAMNLYNYPNLSLSADDITYDELSVHEICSDETDDEDQNFVVDHGHKTEDEQVVAPYEVMGFIYTNDTGIVNELKNDIWSVLNILRSTWD